MSFIFVDLEAVPPPESSTVKRQQGIKGARRKLAKAVLSKARKLMSTDEREFGRAFRKGVEFLPATDVPGTPTHSAFQEIVRRLESVLSLQM